LSRRPESARARRAEAAWLATVRDPGPSRAQGVAILVLLALLYAGAAKADRPKIGLALGGGGAKGGAHVGVLEVLEELNVPVDYIAGTSIGAIVGGLYASGMSAAEIRQSISAVNWDEVLQDEPPRRDLTFRRKEEDSRYLFDLGVGIGRGGFRFPGGLINGQNLFFMLQALTLPVANVTDFDQLPIPFHAVATNVNTGEMVVLKQGQLASAIRASMALPGVFAPVDLDGLLLIDGGLVRNLPVDVVREMGADIVIAVDLGAPLSTRDVQRSIGGVLSQTMRMLTRPNVEPQLRAADIAIIPPVSVFGTMSFDDIGPIMDLGYEKAREHEDELRRYSVTPEEFARHRAAQTVEEAEAFPVAFVEFEGNERVDDRIVEHQIRLEPGAEMRLSVLADDVRQLLSPRTRKEMRRQRLGLDGIDLRALSVDMRRLYGLGDFERVDFTFEEREGEEGVVIRMKEKPWGPNFMHFGLQITSDGDGTTELELLLNLTNTRLNARGGEWRNDLLLGKSRSVFSEFYQPLDFRGKFFVAPGLAIENRRPTFWEDGQAIADLDVQLNTAYIDFGYQFDVYGEMRLGVERAAGDVRLETGALPPDALEGFDPTDIDIGGIRFQSITDRLDSVTFPRKGSNAVLRAFFALEDLGSDDDYTKAEAFGSRFMSRGRHTGFGTIRIGWSPGSELPIYDEFTLGGFGSLGGFADQELRGQYLGLLRLGYYQRRWRSWYIGGLAEAGNVWETSSEADFDTFILSGTALIGKDTPIGPLYVAYSQAEEGKNKIYFVLGRTL
jgi:NTE family protein